MAGPKLPRTTAPSVLGLKQTINACLLSGLIAGAITVVTSERAAPTDTGPTFSVNRINKADRLHLAPVGTRLPPLNSSSTIKREVRPPIPDGCERSFSPIVDPARANIVSYCLT